MFLSLLKMSNTLLLLLLWKKRQLLINSTKRRKRHLRVHPILQGRDTRGTRILIEELRLDSARFLNYFRMSADLFDKLLNKVGPHIAKIDTFREDVISPSQRLALTLRSLASGDSMTSLYYSYRISLTSVSNIMRETTKVLWDVLAPEVFIKYDQQEWKKIAGGFQEKWNFPHCIGAIDGKHVVIQIFMGKRKHLNKSMAYDVMRSWMRDGLELSKGAKWVARRKILTPAFHINILKDFTNVFNEQMQSTLETIRKNCGAPIDVFTLSAEFTLQSICETTMGYKLNTEDENNEEYLQAVKEISGLVLYRIIRPWLYPDFIFFFTPSYWKERKCLKILHGFTRRIIRERMDRFEGTSGPNTVIEDKGSDDIYLGKKKRRLALLDVLLQGQKDDGLIDYEGICEEVDTFVFGGHDTTATALSFCMMLIANHPKVQDEIVEEISGIMNGRTDPSYEDLQNMDYFERCIKESLRLYPSAFIISREADEDTVLNSGLVVPKGSMVLIHVFDVLRDPRAFPSPDVFDPDRFLPENCKQRHPFAYIPFSAGPRNCIGQRFALLELKAFLTGILSNFVLTPIDTPETIVLETNLVLRTKDVIRVKFTPRK